VIIFLFLLNVASWWPFRDAQHFALLYNRIPSNVDCVWNVMAHAQKLDFVSRRNGRVHLNGRGRQFSRLLAAELCASAVVMLDTPSSEVVWRVLATHSIRQFPLHFASRASPCAITFQLDSTSDRLSTLLSLNTRLSQILPRTFVTVFRTARYWSIS